MNVNLLLACSVLVGASATDNCAWAGIIKQGHKPATETYTWAVPAATNWVPAPNLHDLGSNSLQSLSNQFELNKKLYLLRRSMGLGTNAPVLAPGTYKTEPYSMLVRVPGPHPDDKMIVGVGGRGPSMPMRVPDLRFIPRPGVMPGAQTVPALAPDAGPMPPTRAPTPSR